MVRLTGEVVPGLAYAEGILLEGLRSANVSSTVSHATTCLQGTQYTWRPMAIIQDSRNRSTVAA